MHSLSRYIEENLLQGEAAFSDIQLNQGQAPRIRVPGGLKPFRDQALGRDELEYLLLEHCGDRWKDELEKRGGQWDTVIVIGDRRFRTNLFYFNNCMLGLSMRKIPEHIPDLASLGLPESILSLLDTAKGLILVTGATGSGKSTTLASMIEHVNANRADHIVTAEDPVEYVFAPKMSIITQREIGRDSANFHDALRAALRQQPDVIMVGELRDRETIEIAMTAASTGHLVLGTLHTANAESTVNRILSAFPPDARAQAQDVLASVLRAVISQVLVPNTDRTSKVLAYEILINNAAVTTHIRQKELQKIRNAIRDGRQDGMCLLNDTLKRLVDARRIRQEDALHHTYDAEEFDAWR